MINPLELIGNGFKKVFGTRNDRLLKRYNRAVDEINPLEAELRGDYDEQFARRSAGIERDPGEDPDVEAKYRQQLQALRVELSQALRERTASLRQRLAAGEPIERVISEAFALVREASRRAQNHRHFDCQLVGGQVLFEGKVAEMKTGEGKTIVCHLAAFLKYLQGKKVHIVTVNDYLVQRDAQFARPIFELLGVTVGYIQSQVDPGGYEGVRQKAYACDITYGTNNEFGFDYLRDNMKIRPEAQVQQNRLEYAVVDEVDSILIDEARTPLIISGPAEDDVTRYRTADAVARTIIEKQQEANRETAARVRSWGDDPPEAWRKHPKFEEALKKFRTDPLWINEDMAESLGHKQLFVVARERKSVHLTHEGVSAAQETLGVGSLYVGANMEWPHLIESAVRGHVVYEKDVDYVVKDGEVIIVDEFTGRLMHGRQWSDGLHQAIEAKERVRIKEETQTLATITLQNFFKLYQSIAGMTGTAMTEADEFMKIYKLDVVAVPTNRPVNRVDHNDRIYKTVDDKYKWIVEEIHDIRECGRPNDAVMLERALIALRQVAHGDAAMAERIDAALAAFAEAQENKDEAKHSELAAHAIELMTAAFDEGMGNLSRGRPILVGTTSIENSEKLSGLLTKRYGIEHEVLNAKQHAREAEIVAKAGHRTPAVRGDKRPRGNVTIATNMAGRGTDIKLEKGVVYEKCIGDLGPPDDSSPAASRHWTWHEPGVIGTKCCVYCPDYDARTNCAHCWKPKLDPRFPLMGRTVCPVSAPCGLHIVGTERHESRRIDNQLRGRAGRQGDPGTSQFFLSISDELMRMFMGDKMLWLLERFGFEEGMAIEHRSVNKAIERAQKKVEERNFSIRKHLLEYDEVMDHQRRVFYQQRQSILERRGLTALIWKMIDEAIDDAVKKYLSPTYAGECIASLVRSRLECTLNPKRLAMDDFRALQEQIREAAREESRNQIGITVGEYLDPDVEPEQWDIRGLARWAETRFGASVSQNQLRKMSTEEIQALLVEAAEKHIDEEDLSALEPFLAPDYGRTALLDWARQKFGIDFRPDDFADVENDRVEAVLAEKLKAEYRRREVRYPVEWILERTLGQMTGDSAYAVENLVNWVNYKFNVGWTVDTVRNREPRELAELLLQLSVDYSTNGKLEAEIDQALAAESDVRDWAARRFGRLFDARAYDEAFGGNGVNRAEQRDFMLRTGRAMLRHELSMLEQYVLLQTYDQAWKDHMHAMDMLKEAIGLRAYAEQDPKIAYKREGFRMFNEMMQNVREKVTSIIFRARLTDDSAARSAYRIGAARHDDATNAGLSRQA
ncbi:MAG: hypothetical protein HUU22_14035, partial [Phycisphaerae bacterium]|nr:hypothetical protein [Phycisphaerae bacterium]